MWKKMMAIVFDLVFCSGRFNAEYFENKRFFGTARSFWHCGQKELMRFYHHQNNVHFGNRRLI